MYLQSAINREPAYVRATIYGESNTVARRFREHIAVRLPQPVAFIDNPSELLSSRPFLKQVLLHTFHLRRSSSVGLFENDPELHQEIKTYFERVHSAFLSYIHPPNKCWWTDWRVTPE